MCAGDVICQLVIGPALIGRSQGRIWDSSWFQFRYRLLIARVWRGTVKDVAIDAAQLGSVELNLEPSINLVSNDHIHYPYTVVP